MTETTATSTGAACRPAGRIHPADILMHLIVTILTPMFLIGADGDIDFARQAARETIRAYRARDSADLIDVAQIIACGLIALGSLGLSLADNLSLSMTLRLRGNAVALNRSAELNRRAIRNASTGAAMETDRAGRYDDEPIDPAVLAEQEEFETKVAAHVAASQKLAAAVPTIAQGTRPPPALPSQTAPPYPQRPAAPTPPHPVTPTPAQAATPGPAGATAASEWAHQPGFVEAAHRPHTVIVGESPLSTSCLRPERQSPGQPAAPLSMNEQRAAPAGGSRISQPPPAPVQAANHPAPMPAADQPARKVDPSAMTERQQAAIWATAMSDVAREYTTSLVHLPPKERKAASIRAAILSSCATSLMTGEYPAWYKLGLPIGPNTI